jgi:hypothetical protein
MLELGSLVFDGGGRSWRGAEASNLVTVIIVGRSSILFRTTMQFWIRGFLSDSFSSVEPSSEGAMGLPSQSISPRRHAAIFR